MKKEKGRVLRYKPHSIGVDARDLQVLTLALYDYNRMIAGAFASVRQRNPDYKMNEEELQQNAHRHRLYHRVFRMLNKAERARDGRQ